MIISISKYNLNLKIEGRGEPILFLHGFPDSNRVWRKITPVFLKSGYQVICPDLIGFGKSSIPGKLEDYSLDSNCSVLTMMLDKLQIPKVKLVGHDLGSTLGWHLVARYPERFENFVSLSRGHPKACFTNLLQIVKAWYALVFMMPALPELLLPAKDWAVFKYISGHQEMRNWIENLSREGRLTAGLNWYRANFKNFLFPDCAKARVPVLGMWGTSDRFVGNSQMIASVEHVSTLFEYKEIKGASHWIQLDEPERVAESIIDFYMRNKSLCQLSW